MSDLIRRRTLLLALTFFASAMHAPTGVHGQGLDEDATGQVRHWNQVAIDASGRDHTPVAPGENRVFGEQYGPTRASRAMAIVHIAVFDAVNAIDGDYESYS